MLEDLYYYPMSMTLFEKEVVLEEWVDTCLGVLEHQGLVNEYHRLLRSREYPDVWVKDSKEREWLFDCKNIAEWIFSKPKRSGHPVGTKWMHSKSWVDSHIINKKWNENSYPIKDRSNTSIHATVRTRNPKPGIIIPHYNFDSEAREALVGLVGDNVIIFGEQLKTQGSGIPKLAIYFQLRRLFAS